MEETATETMQVNLKLNIRKYLAVKQYAKRHNVTTSSLFDRAMDIILGDECKGDIVSSREQNMNTDIKEVTSEKGISKDDPKGIDATNDHGGTCTTSTYITNYDDEWMQVVKTQTEAHTAIGFAAGSSAVNNWLDAITSIIKAMIGKKEQDNGNGEAIF